MAQWTSTECNTFRDRLSRRMAEMREDSGSAQASGNTEPIDKTHWLGGKSVLDNGDANRESQIRDSDTTESHSVPDPQQLQEEVSSLRTSHHDTLRRLNCHSGQLVDLERALICEQAKQKGREQLNEFFTLCTTGSESEHQTIIDSLRKIEKFGDNRCAKMDERIADVEGLEKRTKRMFQRMNDQNLWYKTLVTGLDDCKREIAVLRKHQEDTAGIVAQTKGSIRKLQQCVQELFEARTSTAQTEDSIRKLQQCVQELSEAQTKFQRAESVQAEYTAPKRSVSHSGEASEPRGTGDEKERSLNGGISVGLQGQPENEVTPAAFQKLSQQVTDLQALLQEQSKIMKEKDAGMQTWVDAQVRQAHNVRSAKSNQTVTANQDQQEQRSLGHETRKMSESGLAVSESVSDPDEETTSSKTPPKDAQPILHEDGQAQAEHLPAKESFMTQNGTTEQWFGQSNQSSEGIHRGTPEPLPEQLDQSSEDMQDRAPEPLLEQMSQTSEDMQDKAPESLWGQSSHSSVDATDLTTPDMAREDRPDIGSSDSPNEFAGSINDDGSQSTTNKSEIRETSRSVERYEWWDE